ncbi:MAG TPA: prolyl oligopeptidase family serine peptidase [Phenylobacterium sp.]|uniref:prolyl oligopeptidase family serine peptidase n=1 Tax=Phenylobacterium sp. TaxID=1871053 RepID=UPI002CEC0AD0|nr:prolyl oligopeptidase family serine peptidase [Phenylobacterium sp.]HXA39438.1 prolyl oligopeptidase family serine peptidase [Phenylobacterium sp.]
MGAAPTPDPYAYMEEAEGAKALAFARAENARSLPQLQNDPRYAGHYADALKIATAKDRIPGVALANDGTLRDFWQDADHVRGVWRATTLASYRTAAPEWRTILDVDALAKAEGRNWVFKGAQCLKPAERYCLVSLSNGGKDAVEIREFDTQSGAFVEGGFQLPEAKANVAWIDKDTLAIATEWTPGDLTQSSYPYILKILKRGQPLGAAREVYRGEKTDVSVSPVVLREPGGAVAALLAQRGLDFFNSEHRLITPTGGVKIDLPTKATIQAYVEGQLVVTLEQDWPQKGFKEGDLIAFDLAAVKANPGDLKGTLVLRPGASQAIDEVASTRHRLTVVLYENVKAQLLTFRHAGGGWTSAAVALPKDSTISVSSTADLDDSMIANVTSFLTPSSQWLADDASGKAQMLKTTPARFDASKDVVEQLWATSKDGTKIPYWVVRPKGLKLDGTAPTLLTAYGGFQLSQTPAYAAMAGKLWLEKGGVYVLANIRGGGEFGPRWHNAGLKLNRMRVYEDFFAVSRDLIARRITSPKKLGIEGGSNGGLLMGVALTQHPELYNAIVIQVPLFDMIGYTHIGAGASWVGEYGDPAVPAERAVLDSYSPYQLLAAGKPYPRVFLETSTKDDRVHPAHARKAAARLKELGYDYLYYENVDGGHAASANLNERAMRVALEYTYLAQRLMD